MTAVTAGSPAVTRAAAWLRAGRGGMFLLALLVGAGAGLGAVAFRYLVYFFTWLATGHSEFGQAGHVGQHPPAVAGPGLLRGDPGDRRAAVRPADLHGGRGRRAGTACPR